MDFLHDAVAGLGQASPLDTLSTVCTLLAISDIPRAADGLRLLGVVGQMRTQYTTQFAARTVPADEGEAVKMAAERAQLETLCCRATATIAEKCPTVFTTTGTTRVASDNGTEKELSAVETLRMSIGGCLSFLDPAEEAACAHGAITPEHLEELLRLLAALTSSAEGLARVAITPKKALRLVRRTFLWTNARNLRITLDTCVKFLLLMGSSTVAECNAESVADEAPVEEPKPQPKPAKGRKGKKGGAPAPEPVSKAVEPVTPRTLLGDIPSLVESLGGDAAILSTAIELISAASVRGYGLRHEALLVADALLTFISAKGTTLRSRSEAWRGVWMLGRWVGDGAPPEFTRRIMAAAAASMPMATAAIESPFTTGSSAAPGPQGGQPQVGTEALIVPGDANAAAQFAAVAVAVWLGAAPLLQPVLRWSFAADDADGGQREAYPSEGAAALTTAVLQKQDTANVVSQRRNYAVDFRAMTQRNTDSGRVRRLAVEVAPRGVDLASTRLSLATVGAIGEAVSVAAQSAVLGSEEAAWAETLFQSIGAVSHSAPAAAMRLVCSCVQAALLPLLPAPDAVEHDVAVLAGVVFDAEFSRSAAVLAGAAHTALAGALLTVCRAEDPARSEAWLDVVRHSVSSKLSVLAAAAPTSTTASAVGTPAAGPRRPGRPRKARRVEQSTKAESARHVADLAQLLLDAQDEHPEQRKSGDASGLDAATAAVADLEAGTTGKRGRKAAADPIAAALKRIAVATAPAQQRLSLMSSSAKLRDAAETDAVRGACVRLTAALAEEGAASITPLSFPATESVLRSAVRVKLCGGSPGGKCMSGHPLRPHHSVTWTCDGCGRASAVHSSSTGEGGGAGSMACRACDFDLCQRCFERRSGAFAFSVLAAGHDVLSYVRSRFDVGSEAMLCGGAPLTAPATRMLTGPALPPAELAAGLAAITAAMQGPNPMVATLHVASSSREKYCRCGAVACDWMARAAFQTEGLASGQSRHYAGTIPAVTEAADTDAWVLREAGGAPVDGPLRHGLERALCRAAADPALPFVGLRPRYPALARILHYAARHVAVPLRKRFFDVSEAGGFRAALVRLSARASANGGTLLLSGDVLASGLEEPRGSVTVQRGKAVVGSGARDVLSRVRTVRGRVGIQFEGEAGFGEGPTQEFYGEVSGSLVADGRLWAQQGATAAGLVPLPEDGAAVAPGVWDTLGRCFGRALIDGFLMNVQLSPAVWAAVLTRRPPPQRGGPSSWVEAVAAEADPALWASMKAIHAASAAELEAMDIPLHDEDDAAPVCPATRAGFVDSTLRTAAALQPTFAALSALRRGVGLLVDCASLAVLFTPAELDSVCCGTRASLDKPLLEREALQRVVTTAHGYSDDSRQVQWLVDTLVEDFTPEEQGLFVEFLTGSAKLPCGGLAGLGKPVTVVRKDFEQGAPPEQTLPSCSTCFLYLKLPPYQSREQLCDRLRYAVSVGRGNFALS